jgi:biopolymer transport protein ExbB
MDNALGFEHFLIHSDGVARFILFIMLTASLTSWYLIITKGVELFKLRRRSAEFLKDFWDAPSLEAVAQRIHNQGIDDPFSHLVHHGFTAIEHINHCKQGTPSSLIEAGAPDEMLTRSLKRSIEEDKTRLEFGQTLLATVASSAPFVGLFGTVWGIYHALIAIGATGQSTLDKVAGPVGEALIMTGIGLAVAIPAAIAYNAFARANRNMLSQLNSFGYDVFNFLATGIKTSPQRSDVRTTSERVIELVRAQDGSAHPGVVVR